MFFQINLPKRTTSTSFFAINLLLVRYHQTWGVGGWSSEQCVAKLEFSSTVQGEHREKTLVGYGYNAWLYFTVKKNGDPVNIFATRKENRLFIPTSDSRMTSLPYVGGSALYIIS